MSWLKRNFAGIPVMFRRSSTKFLILFWSDKNHGLHRQFLCLIGLNMKTIFCFETTLPFGTNFARFVLKLLFKTSSFCIQNVCWTKLFLMSMWNYHPFLFIHKKNISSDSTSNMDTIGHSSFWLADTTSTVYIKKNLPRRYWAIRKDTLVILKKKFPHCLPIQHPIQLPQDIVVSDWHEQKF